jgi:hypothetical protein
MRKTALVALSATVFGTLGMGAAYVDGYNAKASPVAHVQDWTQGFKPCATKTSDWCYWDAKVRGGERSFVATNDELFYVDGE